MRPALLGVASFSFLTLVNIPGLPVGTTEANAQLVRRCFEGICKLYKATTVPRAFHMTATRLGNDTYPPQRPRQPIVKRYRYPATAAIHAARHHRDQQPYRYEVRRPPPAMRAYHPPVTTMRAARPSAVSLGPVRPRLPSGGYSNKPLQGRVIQRH